MKDQKRKLVGMIWVCDYQCSDEQQFNCAIWDPINKCSVISWSSDNVQQVSASDMFVYEKYATKVAGTLELVGKDSSGEDALAVIASGIKGVLARPGNGQDCFLKTMSGTVAGSITYIKPGTILNGVSGTLCQSGGEDTYQQYLAKLLPLCSACCFTDWCSADDAPDMVPCVGTWKMTYSPKISNGTRSAGEIIPDYAK